LLHYIAALPLNLIVWVHTFVGVDAFDLKTLTLEGVVSLDLYWSIDDRI
jgi:hypothetical protein